MLSRRRIPVPATVDTAALLTAAPVLAAGPVRPQSVTPNAVAVTHWSDDCGHHAAGPTKCAVALHVLYDSPGNANGVGADSSMVGDVSDRAGHRQSCHAQNVSARNRLTFDSTPRDENAS